MCVVPMTKIGNCCQSTCNKSSVWHEGKKEPNQINGKNLLNYYFSHIVYLAGNTCVTNKKEK